MPTFGELAQNGAIQTLENALSILKDRGWTPGVNRNMSTGEVDIIGAIAIASGAKIKDISDDKYLLAKVVPEARRPSAYVAIEVLEWAVDCDLTAWQDQPDRSFDEVKQTLEKAAQHLKIAASS